MVRATHFFVFLFGLGLPAFANDGSLQEAMPSNVLCGSVFVEIFHDIPVSGPSVTVTRKERRRTVTAERAVFFLESVQTILGDTPETPPEKRRLQLRDEPTEPGTQYITDTYYLPRFIALRYDRVVHKARIRLRQYFIVPEGTTVDSIKHLDASTLRTVKLADGEGPFLKMEFKSGKPTLGPGGEWEDLELVVDKPGIVISHADALKLRESPETYRQVMEEGLYEKLIGLTLTKNGVSSLVNDPEMTREMLHREGLIHEQGFDRRATQTQTNMRYLRKAYRVFFPNPVPEEKPLEVQITLDDQVTEVALRSGTHKRLNPHYRVIELKIPEEYADKSSEELQSLGLGELAQLRGEFLGLQEVEKARPDSSKPANLRRFGIEDSAVRP